MTESLTLQGKRAQIAGGTQRATTVALSRDGGAQGSENCAQADRPAG